MSNNIYKSVEVDLSLNGSNLYIFFGGIAAGIVMPPFEFYSASKIIDENKIFIRDFLNEKTENKKDNGWECSCWWFCVDIDTVHDNN